MDVGRVVADVDVPFRFVVEITSKNPLEREISLIKSRDTLPSDDNLKNMYKGLIWHEFVEVHLVKIGVFL